MAPASHYIQAYATGVATLQQYSMFSKREVQKPRERVGAQGANDPDQQAVRGPHPPKRKAEQGGCRETPYAARQDILVP
jgi:hypothetical protein